MQSCESDRYGISESSFNAPGQRRRACGDSYMGMTSARRSPLRMAATTEPQPAEKEESTKGKRVIVVGGGWAGKRECTETVTFSGNEFETCQDIDSSPSGSYRGKICLAILQTGFGSALALAERGCEVTLLDALPNPGGLASGFRTEKGFAVEAGIKGFWYQVCAIPTRTMRGPSAWTRISDKPSSCPNRVSPV